MHIADVGDTLSCYGRKWHILAEFELDDTYMPNLEPLIEGGFLKPYTFGDYWREELRFMKWRIKRFFCVT